MGLTPRYPSWLTVQHDSTQMLLFQGLSALLPFTAPSPHTASRSKVSHHSAIRAPAHRPNTLAHKSHSSGKHPVIFWHSQVEEECPRWSQPRMTEKEADEGACTSSGKRRQILLCSDHRALPLTFPFDQYMNSGHLVVSAVGVRPHSIPSLCFLLLCFSYFCFDLYPTLAETTSTRPTHTQMLFCSCFALALFYRPATPQSSS